MPDATPPVVLIHGGGCDARIWELLLPHLPGPALAVDLPGRPARPAPNGRSTIDGSARAVIGDIDAAGFDEVVLVGHSMAGSVLPRLVGLLGARVRHVVFVAATVPDGGTSAVDTLDPAFFAMARTERAASDSERFLLIANGLDSEQLDWCRARIVNEAPGVAREPVDLVDLQRSPVPKTWIRTLRDVIVPPAKQLRFFGNIGEGALVDFDAPHMCMVSHPADLAELVSNSVNPLSEPVPDPKTDCLSGEGGNHL